MKFERGSLFLGRPDWMNTYSELENYIHAETKTIEMIDAINDDIARAMRIGPNAVYAVLSRYASRGFDERFINSLKERKVGLELAKKQLAELILVGEGK